jgi:hypothetical protein
VPNNEKKSNSGAAPVFELGRRAPVRRLNMSIFSRNVALLATLGVALVVLFPLGSGPFTATYGPASALRAIAYVSLLFVLLSTLLAVRTDGSESHVRRDLSVAPVAVSASTAVLPLRC